MKNSYLHKKWLYLLAIAVLAALIVLSLFAIMLTHRHSGYSVPAVENPNEVSPYLTHELAPQFWDGIQKGGPFEIIVDEAGLNNIISRDSAVSGGWPVSFDYVNVYAPTVKFLPGKINAVAKVAVDGIKIYVDVYLKAEVLSEGKMRVEIESVKAGAVNITGFAVSIIRDVFEKRFKDSSGTDGMDEIIYAILENRPFEPAFALGEQKLRVYKADLAQSKLVIGFMPITVIK